MHTAGRCGTLTDTLYIISKRGWHGSFYMHTAVRRGRDYTYRGSQRIVAPPAVVGGGFSGPAALLLLRSPPLPLPPSGS